MPCIAPTALPASESVPISLLATNKSCRAELRSTLVAAAKSPFLEFHAYHLTPCVKFRLVCVPGQPAAILSPQCTLRYAIHAGPCQQTRLGGIHGILNSEAYGLEGLRKEVGSHGLPPVVFELVQLLLGPGIPRQDSNDSGDDLHVVGRQEMTAVAKRGTENVVQLVEDQFLKASAELLHFLEKLRIVLLEQVGCG
jgi:hypothetical protein